MRVMCMCVHTCVSACSFLVYVWCVCFLCFSCVFVCVCVWGTCVWHVCAHGMFCVYFMVCECVGVEGSGEYRWSSGDTVGACSQVDASPGSPGFSAPKQPRRSGVADPSRLHLTVGRWGARSHPGTSRGKDAPPAVLLAVSARPLLVPGLCSSAPAPPGPPAPPAPIRCCPGLQSRRDGCQPTRPLLCLINPQAVSKTPSSPPSPAPPCHPGGIYHPGFLTPPASRIGRGLLVQLRPLLAAYVLGAWTA